MADDDGVFSLFLSSRLELAFENEGEIGLALDLLIWHLVTLQVGTYILPLMPSLLAFKNSSLKAIIS